MANYTNITQTLIKGMVKGSRTPVTSPNTATQVQQVVKSFLPRMKMNTGGTVDTVQLSLKKFFNSNRNRSQNLIAKTSDIT